MNERSFLRNAAAATPEQAVQLASYFKSIEHKAKPFVIEEGPGSCVRGNGISIKVLEKRKRIPTYRMVFRNHWTQTEQPEAIKKMIDAAEKDFPELKEFIRYEYGSMD